MFDRVLLVNGTVGVGKTTVAETVAHLLVDAGHACAWLDLDALSACWPPPGDDPFNTRLVATNLARVSAGYADAGARTLVLSGVVEDRGQRSLYERALGQPIEIVRLTASGDAIEGRLRRRYASGDPADLRWHLERGPALDAILDGSGVEMSAVPADDSPLDVARAVLASLGW